MVKRLRFSKTGFAFSPTVADAVGSDVGFYDIARSDLRCSLEVRQPLGQRAQRRTPRHPAYVATSDSTAQPRITAA
jgi:hypothetical protein